MSAMHCLNCNTTLQGAYCHSCGQKGSIHRLSLRHFVAHDLVHGLWHIEGSLPRTLLNVIRWPGRAAVAYIGGRRAGHFNLITLMLVLIGLNFFVNAALYPKGKTVRVSNVEIRSIPFEDTVASSSADKDMHPEAGTAPTRAPARLRQWVRDNGKWIILGTVPVLSLASVIVFRRPRYNYAEHLLISSFFLAGVLLLRLLLTVLEWTFEHLLHRDGLRLVWLAIPLYLGMLYWQAFRAHYSATGWVWRVILLPVLFALIFLLAVVIASALYVLADGGSADGIIQYGS